MHQLASTSLCLLLVALVQLDLVSLQHASHGYRRQMNAMRAVAQKAYEHGLRINEEAMCAKPRPELVYLTDSNKIFLPRATLLHRCSDLTGCCTHSTHSCQPSQVETVSLYFFTISVNSLSRMRQNQNIEKINFVNHTECACVPVDHARSQSESLVNTNETNTALDSRHSFTPVSKSGPTTQGTSVESSSEHTKGAMYNGGVDESQDSNSIDINNGAIQNEDPQNNMLKYWGKLLGLYKTKVHRDVYHSGVRHVQQSPEQNLRRLDSHLTPTQHSQTLAPVSSVGYHGETMAPYQSQLVYLYPSAGSPYNLVTGFNTGFDGYRRLSSDGYKLTYRRLE